VLRRLSEGAWHVGGKARSSDFLAEGGGLGSEDETLGFSFSASGLMMPFHHGVGVALRDAGVLTRSTPLGGSSGGAIAAAALACELPKEEVNEGIVAVAEDCRSYGSFRRMLIPAKKLCDQVLPEDSHHRMNGQVHVSVMEILPRLRPLVVNEWTSKDDVVRSSSILIIVCWHHHMRVPAPPTEQTITLSQPSSNCGHEVICCRSSSLSFSSQHH